MRLRRVQTISCIATLFLATHWVMAQQVIAPDASGDASKARASRAFLTPMTYAPFLSADDPRVKQACGANQSVDQCPPHLRYTGGAAGLGPFIPPSLTSRLPNLHVIFALSHVANTLVAGDGIGGEGEDVDLRFEIDSSASDSESPNSFSALTVGWLDPGVSAPYNTILWQAVVLNGCTDPPPVIPIHFENRITVVVDGMTVGGVLGQFVADDNESLVPPGFWNFDYTAHASNREGDASNFRIRGTVSVVCSARDEA